MSQYNILLGLKLGHLMALAAQKISKLILLFESANTTVGMLTGGDLCSRWSCLLFTLI